MSKKITLKERARRVANFNIECLKLVGVTGQAAASGLATILVIETAYAGLQGAANVRGKKACGVKPKYATTGHLWWKETKGVVETPLQSFEHKLPAQKGGK